jgi:hypothetical protein
MYKITLLIYLLVGCSWYASHFSKELAHVAPIVDAARRMLIGEYMNP